MTGLSAGALLKLPVRLHGVRLGWPVDVIFDRELRRALGLEIHCGDDTRRFLPFAVATRDAESLAVPSSLVLLDQSELGFYTQRGATFASLRGGAVSRGGRSLGSLHDLVLTDDGTIEHVVVESPRGRVHIRYDTRVQLTAAGVRAAS